MNTNEKVLAYAMETLERKLVEKDVQLQKLQSRKEEVWYALNNLFHKSRGLVDAELSENVRGVLWPNKGEV